MGVQAGRSVHEPSSSTPTALKQILCLTPSCWQWCRRQDTARTADTSAARAQTEMAALRQQIRALEQEVKVAKGQAADTLARSQNAETAAARR